MKLHLIRYWSPAGGDAFGALAAAAHKRELRESVKYSCNQDKTKQKILIYLPIYYELCCLQTFTFPDSKLSCQKFGFIFQYFFCI